MSWLIVGFTITILISNVSSYTTIPGDTTWIDTVDNSEPNYYQTRTDAETGDGNYWYYPEYDLNRVNDQGGLAGVTGTVPGTGEAVWGWWNYWWQNSNGINSEDQDRSMVRSFACGSVGTVDVSFNFWMCTSSSNTVATWKRISSQGLVTDDKTYGGGCFTDNSGAWGQNPAGTQCTGINIKRCQVSETFITEGPLDTIELQFMFAAYSNSPGQTYHTGAMNGLQVKCIRRETDPPTRQPTSTTPTPSIPPSKTPSKTPTESPTPAPTGNPTRNPTTHQPTASPTTPIPSKFPSKHPTPETQSPTIDPTSNPIPRPSTSPTNNPASRPVDEFEPCIDEFILFSDNKQIQISIQISRKTNKMNMILEGPNDRWFGIGFGGNTMKDTYVITVNEAIEERKLGDHKRGTDITNTFNSVENIPLPTKHIVSLIRDYKIDNNVNVFDFTDFFNCNIAELNVIWAIGVELTFGYHFEKMSSSFFSCACNDSILSTVYVEPSIKPTAKPTEDILGNESWCLSCMYSLIIGIITTMLCL